MSRNCVNGQRSTVKGNCRAAPDHCVFPPFRPSDFPSCLRRVVASLCLPPLTVHRLLLTLFLLLGTSCRATTSRPTYLPLPTAVVAEVELGIPEATRVLAETMAKDSIALARIKEADGFIDSGWLDAKTLEHTGARPLGTNVVRVRAWVNPSKLNWSQLVVEGTYRAMDDPSRPERELDVQLPDDHPLQKRLGDVIRKMIEKYGDKEALKALAQPAAKPGAKPDSAAAKPGAKPDSAAKRDSLRLKADSLKAKKDTVKLKRDTTRVKRDTAP